MLSRKDDKVKQILDAAHEILIEEGIEELSIRKIARKIKYSPSIVYHYFNDKDDIIKQLIQRGYKKLISGLQEIQSLNINPQDKLNRLIRKYIELALEIPDEYKIIHLNNNAEIINNIRSLYLGAAKDKNALRILYDCIKDVNENKGENEVELLAQIIFTSSFGLIIKIINEKVEINQQQRLIDQLIKMIDMYLTN